MNANENKIVSLSIVLVVLFAFVIASYSQVPMMVQPANSGGLYISIGGIILMTVVFTLAIGGVFLGIFYYYKQNSVKKP